MGPGLLYDPCVSIGSVYLVGTYDPRLCPCRRKIHFRADIGCGGKIGKGTRLPLVIVQVLYPFGEEGGHIAIDGGRFHVYLGIACPSLSFIPLGAIGGYIKEIG
jgi:hypothetical protein